MAKVILLFGAIFDVTITVAAVVLVYLLGPLGLSTGIERLARSVFNLNSFTLDPALVGLYVAAGGAMISALATIAMSLAALIYNLISDLVGGIAATATVEDSSGAQPRR